jgi:hypothetical protein
VEAIRQRCAVHVKNTILLPMERNQELDAVETRPVIRGHNESTLTERVGLWFRAVQKRWNVGRWLLGPGNRPVRYRRWPPSPPSFCESGGIRWKLVIRPYQGLQASETAMSEA